MGELGAHESYSVTIKAESAAALEAMIEAKCLFTAAPELLEVLRWLSTEDCQCDAAAFRCKKAQARAVVAKAEGRVSPQS